MQRIKRLINVLIVEDDIASAIIVKHELSAAGFILNFNHTDLLESVKTKLTNNKFDVIISDHNLETFTSLDVLELRNELAPETPFVIFTMHMPEKLSEQVKRLGCTVVLNKLDTCLLPRVIENITG